MPDWVIPYIFFTLWHLHAGLPQGSYHANYLPVVPLVETLQVVDVDGARVVRLRRANDD